MRIEGSPVTICRGRSFRAAISSATALLLAASIASGQSGRQIEPLAGTWKTYVLGSGNELTVAAPPNGPARAREIAWLKSLPDDRNTIVRDQIRYWDAGAPAYRWIEIALNTALVRRPGARQPV